MYVLQNFRLCTHTIIPGSYENEQSEDQRERKRTSGNLNYETERLEVVKNLSANAGDITDAVSIAGLGRSLGGAARQPTITGLDIRVQ